MVNTEYCIVNYVEKDHIVLLTWKKFCCGDDYRMPVLHALKLLGTHVGSNLVIDARNGFEDTDEDAEWAKSEFIPEMAKTDCNKVVFILNAANHIEGEINLWTKEFGKYFKVYRVPSYDDAMITLRYEEDQIVMHVTYTVKPGTRDIFYQKISDNGIIDKSRGEKGNLKYDYFYPTDSNNMLMLIEIWKDAEAQRIHNNSEHFELLQEIKQEYVTNVQIEQYYVNTSII